jgi:phosphoribosyl-ATP pyrophosphohydrolase
MKEAAKKLGEEAAEVSVAALAEDKERTVDEAADLLYHLVLLLQMKGINMDKVYNELWRRRR